MSMALRGEIGLFEKSFWFFHQKEWKVVGIQQLGLSTIAILTVTYKAARFALCAYGAAVNLVAMELPKHTGKIDPGNGMKS